MMVLRGNHIAGRVGAATKVRARPQKLWRRHKSLPQTAGVYQGAHDTNTNANTDTNTDANTTCSPHDDDQTDNITEHSYDDDYDDDDDVCWGC